MTPLTILTVGLGAWLGPLAPAVAQPDADAECKQDVLLRALVDELTRNKERLSLPGLPPPYFLEFSLSDMSGVSVGASLGHVTYRRRFRQRPALTTLRVGSYKLDNTNFSGGFGSWGGGTDADVPIEDDYHAIRQALWWSADRQYKSVTEALERKKAFMESKMIVDKPDDFSQEPPAVYFEPRVDPPPDVADLEPLAVVLSTVFRRYAAVQRSEVNVAASTRNRYLVNSEGTRIRTASTLYALRVVASVEAPDGMPLQDSFIVDGETREELPSPAELEKRCVELAESLVRLAAAPKLETYTGPVLFDAKPAAYLFLGQFAQRFCGGQRPVGGETSPDDFENKIGQRILPRFLNVVDDPTHTTIAGVRVRGHYAYDDQGVKAQPVTLVEQGSLTGLLMSRNPSKKFKNSNGHGRGFFGGSASIGCLIVSADPGLSDADLRKDLLEAAADEDLEFGVRVASLAGGGDGTSPLHVYKVFPDGREELVRGAQIARLELKEFKKVRSAGDKPYVLNQGDASGFTVAVPALLFEELDLAKVDRDFDKPPVIESPVARALAAGQP